MAIITEEIIKEVADIIRLIIPALSALVGAYFGYLFSKRLFNQQKEHENRIRKEERYLELLRKFDSFLIAFSMGVKELAKEKDPIKGEELKKRIENRMLDFASTRAIADLFGTHKITTLIEEINDAVQEMTIEVINLEKEGNIITDPKELKSSSKFFAKKAELINEIRKEIGQPTV
jgi:hypothetical protein